MKVFRQGGRKQSSTCIEVESNVSAGIAGDNRNQLLDQVPVHLKEGSRADLIVVIAGSMANRFSAGLSQRSRVSGPVVFFLLPRGFCRRSLRRNPAPGKEKCYAVNFRQFALDRLRPARQISAFSRPVAECPGQQVL